MKEVCILKLLNHILQPTIYDDIREVAREYLLEENVDKYLVRPPNTPYEINNTQPQGLSGREGEGDLRS